MDVFGENGDNRDMLKEGYVGGNGCDLICPTPAPPPKEEGKANAGKCFLNGQAPIIPCAILGSPPPKEEGES